MIDYGIKAEELFLQGYNCAQAVIGALADRLGMSLEDALRISAGFGGGLGRLREVCGAFSGLTMALSLKYGQYGPKDDGSKTALYAKVQFAAEAFKEKFGSLTCRELLGIAEKKSTPEPDKRTPEFYKTRPCAEFVRYAAELAAGLIEEE